MNLETALIVVALVAAIVGLLAREFATVALAVVTVCLLLVLLVRFA